MKKFFLFLSLNRLYLLLSFLVGFFLISKSIFIPGCFSFDQTDDAITTFVNLSYVKEALGQGHWPLINLYNNFGTPIVGDALTYPLAFHSLTYFFFPPEIAMGINRFFLISLTLFFLCYYFNSKMSPFSSCLSSLFVVLSPGFIWHAAHHPYQASILFFSLGLILQERISEKKGFFVFFLFSLFFIFLFQNMSLNLVCLMVPFLFFNQIIIAKKNFWRNSLLFCAAFLLGALSFWKDLYYFFEMMNNSIRVAHWYVPPHLIITMRFPIFVFGAALLSFRWFNETKNKTQYIQVILLGLCPMLCVIFLKNNPGLWQRIPLLKSTDISRVWWLSNVFLVMGMGITLDKIFLMKKNRTGYFTLIYALLFVEIFSLIIGWKRLFSWGENADILIFLVIILGGVFLLIRFKFTQRKSFFIVHYISIGGVFVGTMMYFVVYMFGFIPLNSCETGRHYFSSKGKDLFSPRSFIEYISPHSRLAVDMLSNTGLGIKIGRDHVLGSMGRSVFLGREFVKFLFNQKLIEPDQYSGTYHFKAPWRADKLRRFGISYVMQKGLMKNDNDQNWELLAQESGYSLYKNRLLVSLVYFYDSQGTYVAVDSKDIKLGVNTISVKLPLRRKARIELVATWKNLLGWNVYVDGERKDFIEKEDRLLRVEVGPQEERVVFKFQPFL